MFDSSFLKVHIFWCLSCSECKLNIFGLRRLRTSSWASEHSDEHFHHLKQFINQENKKTAKFISCIKHHPDGHPMFSVPLVCSH